MLIGIYGVDGDGQDDVVGDEAICSYGMPAELLGTVRDELQHTNG
jgi:hypothetical protein